MAHNGDGKKDGAYSATARTRTRRANKARIKAANPGLEGKALRKRVGKQTKAAIVRHKERGVTGPQGKTAAEYKAETPKKVKPNPSKERKNSKK